MKLKNITLIFENCDYLTIDGKYIGDLIVDDLHTCFRRIACNAIEKVETANTFAIEIHRDANKDRHQFGQSDVPHFKQKVFDRIEEYDDITHIEFELEETYVEDGEVPRVEHYEYGVNWVGDSEYENEAQTTYISSGGNMYLVIAEGKGIEDFFDKGEINDEDAMDFHFDMCDVGDRYGEEQTK